MLCVFSVYLFAELFEHPSYYGAVLSRRECNTIKCYIYMYRSTHNVWL